MQSGIFVIFMVLTVWRATVSGRILSECDIARELNNRGFARDQLANWVCLVLSESSGNTAAVGGPNSDGSFDYGLFQINDRYWCEHGVAGKGCNLECGQLVSEDISAAANCARTIFNAMGFNAWYGWQRKCQGQPLPNINNCF